MKCHLCQTGTLRLVKQAVYENARNFPEPIVPTGPGDTLFVKRCSWCKAHILTIEKIDRLVKPPDPDKLKAGREAAQRSNERTLELYETLAQVGGIEG